MWRFFFRFPSRIFYSFAALVTFVSASLFVGAAQAQIGLAIATSPDPVAPGQKLLYTITVTNQDNVTRSFTVTAPVPAHTTVAAAATLPGPFCDGAGFITCQAGQLMRWSTGGIGAGKSETIRLAALVDNPVADGTQINFSVTTNNNVGDVATATQQSIVLATANAVNLVLSDVPSSVKPGTALTYTLNFANPGLSAFSGRLDMPVPAGTSFVSATGGGTLVGNTVQWSLGTVATGSFGTRQLTVNVNPGLSDGTLIGGEASLIDTVAGQRRARATAVSAVVATPVIGLAIATSPDPVAPGQKLLYTITVTNQDNVTRSFTVTAPVPAHTTVAAAATLPGPFCDGAGFITCQAGQLMRWSTGGIAVGGSVTFQFTATINAINPPGNGTLIYTKVVTWNNVGDRSAATAVTPFPFNLTPNNIAPIADAGPPKAVNVGISVGLDGSTSTDPDAGPSPLTFSWQQTSGPATVVLSNANTATPSFPTSVAGTYVFTLTVSDGAASDSDTVQVTVNQPNRAPTASADSFSTPANTPLNVAAPGVLGNDSDPDGNVLSVQLQANPLQGVLVLNSNGSFTYTPPNGFSGQVTFTYRANDGQTANNLSADTTVTINVSAVNVVPIATAGPDQSVNVGTPVTLDGRASRDPDAGPSALTFAWRQTGGPSVTLAGANSAQPTFTPSVVGSYVFELSVSDGAASAVDTVQIVAVQPNRAPVAGNESFSTQAGTVLNIAAPGVLGNDSDADGNTLTVQLQTGPVQGTLLLNPNGSFTYTPVAGFVGTLTFAYRANDGQANNNLSNIATVTINVTSVPNQPPTANAGPAQSVNVGALVTLDGRGSGDPDSGPSPLTFAWRQISGPPVTLARANTAQPTFTPAAAGAYEFGLTVNDGAASASSAVRITVAQPNRAPVASNDTYTTAFNSALIVPAAGGVLGNDTDADAHQLTAQLQSGPTQGTLLLNPNGSFTYTPPAGFSGGVSFTYRANDGQLVNNLSNTATVAITVNPPSNVAPTANAGSNRVVRAGSLVTLDGSASRDPDNGPSPLTFLWAQSGAPPVALTGATTALPSFSASVAALYTFTLTVNDGSATSAPSTVQVRVALRGDVDLDGDVDRADTALILAARGQAASGANDLRDLNGDGRIDVLDARIDATLCTRANCATQ